LALKDPINEIAKTIRAVLERISSELANDIVDNGLVLTGGGAQVRELDRALRQFTGLPVVVAEEPATAVVRGAGQLFETRTSRNAVAC
jgi:rod shape-determining protein MreB